MTIHIVTVKREDENSSRKAAVLVDAKDTDEAAVAALEFARGHIFFGTKPEYVEWLESWAVEFPYVVRVDPQILKKSVKRPAKHK